MTGWSSADLYTDFNFGFGTFRWFVEGAIDKFDPNVALGMFTYEGTEYIHEINIEIAKFGNTEPAASNFFYTVSPHKLGINERVLFGKHIALEATCTTHQFTRTADYVIFQSQHGFRTSPNENVFSNFTTPVRYSSAVPYLATPLHLSLWTFQGIPPTDGKEVEIIIHDFQYVQHSVQDRTRKDENFEKKKKNNYQWVKVV